MSVLKTITPDSTVNEVVEWYPETLPVFGRYGIDTCCGGLKSLREVSDAHQVPLDRLLGELHGVIAPAAEVILDVRPDLAAGRDPLERILAAADRLGPGQRLVVVVHFEPVPLYSVLGQRGFQHISERGSDGTWRVTFFRGQPPG
ncbi:MAG TPA: DUF542 domain-containing protein [Isosphaeraceae bacterium]|nr:DUF542 domain-containing protein [Isosphaeraceae bacterium]